MGSFDQVPDKLFLENDMQSFCNTCIKLAFVITHCIAGAFGDKNIFNQILFMHFKNECEQHVIRGKIPCMLPFLLIYITESNIAT